MTQPAVTPFTLKKLLVRVVAFVALTTASTALLALPYLGSVQQHASEDRAEYSTRLDEAFQLADKMPVSKELRAMLSAAAKKADRLTSGPDCGAQTWPYIHPRCLAGASDIGAAPPVRTVTVEYRTGPTSSALVRVPLQHLASQP